MLVLLNEIHFIIKFEQFIHLITIILKLIFPSNFIYQLLSMLLP